MKDSLRLFCLSVAGLAALGMVAGCGPATSPTVKVTGTVTYNDAPVEGATVTFTPARGRPATGVTDASGKFVLSTDRPNDGAVEGSHKVTVMPKAADPNMGSSPEEIEAAAAAAKPFPERYNNPETSGFTADVKKGGSNDFSFKMTD